MVESEPLTEAMAMKWRKISTDDYRSDCGRFHIFRMPKEDNKYSNCDEWTLVDGKDAVDVYPLLRMAKAAAVAILDEEKVNADPE